MADRPPRGAMQLLGAPDDLTAVVLVQFDGVTWQLELVELPNDGVPLERRILADALRSLTAKLDEVAERMGG